MGEPWRGEDYDRNADRLLLLGESAYSWSEGLEDEGHPTDEHATELIEDVVGGHDMGRFTTMLSRGLVGKEWPTTEEKRAAWARVAFVNYVDGSVGFGARTRPTTEMWAAAMPRFRPLLARLKPKTVIVLGKTMWSRMPDTDVYLTDDVQVYRLADGSPVVCWAVHHPSGGLSWRRLRAVIAFATGRVV